MPLRRILFIFLFYIFTVSLSAQERYPLYSNDILAQRTWVDSVYKGMTPKERVGQLFMVDVFSSDPKAKIDKIKKLIKEQHIGGLIFSKGGPMRQAKLNNELQAMANTKLLVGMDAEWGLAMRLDSTYAFPWNMTLGAIQDNSIVKKVGRRIGDHSKRLGVHINFAPVVDININPANPIIGNRSFGEDKINVTQKAIALMEGMQDAGVLGSAKHFPGHGDTDKDSHKTLPTLNFSKERLERVELYPYQPIIEKGIASIMVAHLNVPALVPEEGVPTSISPTVVTKMLKEDFKYHGLIITDALNMKGAANFKEPGDIDLAAFKAGNDILLISENVPSAAAKILTALKNGEITEQRLEHSVKKILYAKYKVGLHQWEPVVTTNLISDLNATVDDIVYSEAIENALTVTKNENSVLPIKKLDQKKIAYLALGDANGSAFKGQLRKYAHVESINATTLKEAKEQLTPFNYVIIGFHRSNDNPWKSYKFTSKEINWISEIAKNKTVILDLFVRPYAMLDLPDIQNIEGIIHSYQNSKIAQEKSAQLIFGAIPSKGKLPVSLGDTPFGTGIESGILRRLQYGLPEEVGVDSQLLNTKIDSLVNLGIKKAMMPGAQVLVARRGKVIYDKSFGYHTYNKKRAVLPEDIYDIASMTKILASLPLVMELESKGSLDLDDKLGTLIPELANSNKANISIKSALSHYARFKAWIPFYIYTLDSITKKPSEDFYSSKFTRDYDIKITDKMFLRSDYKDSIIDRIAETDLRDRLSYKYSDLPYYLVKKYLEDYYRKDLDELTKTHFYNSLGANFTGYNPLKRFNKDIITPSENDTYWRNQKIQGTVHDMGAAMQGNVGGHAGLFSNSNDVAKMMQMYLQNGYYGGKRYFSKETMSRFNTCYYCDNKVRRGVGFDKPQINGSGPTCGCVPMSSFGHSGFTGTYTWADPENELIYVFLSNRTFPTMNNRKLIKSGLRTQIQEAIYDAIIQ
ncbi:glycoside hydrolase family 3 N-terminal domain-containing protein [Dokdonia sp. Hel_I_53]|uniref:glycoside hydrolase family 3 N-terminal domain-containing protein n=1 Tax=Dokdonia sp. Hel_I_53 TaxID=1566287 RepID=UPI0011992F39|nr:glycoside hydrolase family 3 N-terminal domain-containing protein [Dokdonia sp. Hel_I_53]TVZ51102.1 beta-glucosidase-like glycosyl hydrolase [Dokdonia sp. Hel_I_53]